MTVLCVDLEYYSDEIIETADDAARCAVARAWFAVAAVVESLVGRLHVGP